MSLEGGTSYSISRFHAHRIRRGRSGLSTGGGLAISLFYQPLVAAGGAHDSKPEMPPHHPISARSRLYAGIAVMIGRGGIRLALVATLGQDPPWHEDDEHRQIFHRPRCHSFGAEDPKNRVAAGSRKHRRALRLRRPAVVRRRRDRDRVGRPRPDRRLHPRAYLVFALYRRSQDQPAGEGGSLLG